MLPFVPWTLRPRRRDPRRTDDAERAGRDWLASVYHAEADGVYRYALALCGDPALSADVTQEAFVALAQAPDRFDPARGSLGAYLAGMARHGLLAAWRHRDRHAAWPTDTEGEDLPLAELGGDDAAPHGDPGHEHRLITAQSLDALWAALRALPWPFREAVVLVDLQERPYAEAARIAGIELNTLRTRLHRGRARLAEALGAPAPLTRSPS
ncbi:RNA polymerase sigma factor [Ideonella sp.]|uniref:RNA polymerase sigma factor n=1 Tax=Ideonella sp. TaxID=1929293 RepID=UPI0035AFE3A8